MRIIISFWKTFSLETAVAITNLDRVGTECTQFFSDVTVRDLNHIGRLLDRTWPDDVIESDLLATFDEQVSVLFGDVASSSINLELKTALLDRIEAIRRAITEYRIRGAEGLRVALAAGLGEVVKRSSEIKEEPEKSVFSGFLEVLVSLNALIEQGQRFAPLLQAVGHRLLE